jgi:hypothetical protein
MLPKLTDPELWFGAVANLGLMSVAFGYWIMRRVPTSGRFACAAMSLAFTSLWLLIYFWPDVAPTASFWSVGEQYLFISLAVFAVHAFSLPAALFYSWHARRHAKHRKWALAAFTGCLFVLPLWMLSMGLCAKVAAEEYLPDIRSFF